MTSNVQLTNNAPNQNSPLSASPDLFDSPSAWATSPEAAFDAWLSGQPVAPSTILVRRAMWGKFLRYLNSLGVGLGECSPEHVADFISSSGLEKENGWRYLKLIERVYSHLASLGLRLPNPASYAAKEEKVLKKENAPMRFLDKGEREKLENHIRSVIASADEAIAEVKEEKEKKKKEYAALWAVMRDATVVAVLYGAGLKVSEVIRLSVNCTSGLSEDDFTLTVPRSGFNLERRIQCLAAGGYALSAWLPVVTAEDALGPILFPALVSRRRNDQLTQTAKMHPATLFRRVTAFLDDAGIKDSRACGQTLRNTYAACLIESGMDDDGIAQAMGFTGDFSVAHLRKEHADFFGGDRRG